MNPTIEIISLKNLTTQSDLIRNQVNCVEVSDYSAQSLSIEIMGGHLPIDQLVSISCQIQLSGKIRSFEAIGKVSATMPLSSGSTKIEIHLHQYDKKLWKQFLQDKKEAQNKADDIFNKVKGVA
jgi:hypothetical protein